MPHHAELPPEETIAEHPSPANDPNVINLHESTLEFVEQSAPARAPLRFGRLALWMASASALGIGVLGTVAYSMWFNHDQRVYAEAMSSARRTLGIDQPAIAAQTQSAGAVETPLTAPPPGYVNPNASNDAAPAVDTAALADNPPPPDAGDEPALAAASPSGEGDGGGMATATDATGAAALATAAAASTQAMAATQAQTVDGSPQTAAPAQSAAAQRRGNPSATQVAANRGNPAAQARSRRVAHTAPAAKPESGLFARVGAFFHRVSYRHNVPNRQREEYSRP